MKTDKLVIERQFLILTEGADAYYYLIWMLNSEVFAGDNRFINDIQVLDFGGITELKGYLMALKQLDNFPDVKGMMVIRDAESDYESAVREIKQALLENDMESEDKPGSWKIGSPAICYALFPSCDDAPKNGTLEDLCLSTISDANWDSLQSEIDVFLEKIKTEYGEKYPREFKNKLHVYFSIKDKYVGLKIGEAAKANAFNWDNPGVLSLKRIIKEGLDVSGIPVQ